MKKIYIVLSIVIIATLSLCGCNEPEATKTDNEKGTIILESDIVELEHSSFDIVTKPQFDQDCSCYVEVFQSVDVTYLFHNIAGKAISAKVNVEFYDKDDNLIGIGGPKTINLPKDYTEQGITPANTISYTGYKGEEVYKAIIIAEE